MKVKGVAIMTVFMAVLLLATVAQFCAAGDKDEVEKVFDDFSTAYGRSNFEMMKKVWSHEDDVRLVSTTPPGRSTWIPQGWNCDARGWDVVEHEYDVAFNQTHVTGRFENIVVQIQADKASATFDSVIWGISGKGGVVLFRKEGNEWNVYMCDLDNLEATRSGDESGEYVEIVFEAEDGEGVKEFLREDADASGATYVTGEAHSLFEFDVPEAGEYTIWCRTHAHNRFMSYYSAKLDNIEFRGWGAFCRKWTWSQLNQEGITGPKTFTIEAGKHNVTFSSPIIVGPKTSFGGCKLDALYITDNLSLRADQIQRRFDLTMGYIAEPKAVGARGKLTTTWVKIKNNRK